MKSFRSTCTLLAVCLLAWVAGPALAQSAAGNWDLTERTDDSAIGKMMLSRDGSISFDGTIGSWTQSGNHISATVYGSAQLRNAGMALSKLEFELSGDRMSGTVYVIPQRKTFPMWAHRQGGSTAENASPPPQPAFSTVTAAEPVFAPVQSPHQLARIQQPTLIIPPGRQTCPPGYSPARQANGQYVTTPPAAVCAKDGTAGFGPGATTANNRAQGQDEVAAENANRVASTDTSSASSEPKKKRIEWGLIQLESIAICRQSSKNRKWECNGALDNQTFVDEPTLESALARQHCPGGVWTAGGPTLRDQKWEAYRCGRALGAGDYDVAKRYHLVITARASYICPKYQLGDGRCTTEYDGQDKR